MEATNIYQELTKDKPKLFTKGKTLGNRHRERAGRSLKAI